MVQGVSFKRKQSEKSSKNTAAKAKKALATKRGARVVAPKAYDTIKKNALNKKLTSSINKKTEEAMAVKANSIGQRLKTFKNLPRELSKAEKKANKKK